MPPHAVEELRSTEPAGSSHPGYVDKDFILILEREAGEVAIEENQRISSILMTHGAECRIVDDSLHNLTVVIFSRRRGQRVQEPSQSNDHTTQGARRKRSSSLHHRPGFHARARSCACAICSAVILLQ